MIVGKLLRSAAAGGSDSTGSIGFTVIGFCMGICNGFAIRCSAHWGGRALQNAPIRINAALSGGGHRVVLTAATSLLMPDPLTAMQTPEEILRMRTVISS